MKFFYKSLLYTFLTVWVWVHPASAQQTDDKDLRSLILKNAAYLGITPADAADAVINGTHTDASSEVTYVYLQQTYQQLRVYNTILTAAFRNGSFLYASGTFVKDIAAKAGSPTPTKSVLDAARAAATHLNLDVPTALPVVSDVFNTEKKYVLAPGNIARRNIDVTLYWTPSDDKQTVRLTWNVNIDVKGSDDWWNVRIDAQTGSYVQKDNWTVHENLPDNAVLSAPVLPLSSKPTASKGVVAPRKTVAPQPVVSPQIIFQSPPPNVTSATYRVIPYPAESPLYSAFSNVTNPWLMAGVNNNAATLGWHFDSVANYTITRGNNVFAFLDRQNNNTSNATRNWPDTSTTDTPALTFVHNQSDMEQPLTTENKKAALDNLFYWNNIMHDVTYQYGFTEAAGNFQQQNLGRGGTGNDYVQANGQDSAGYSNANFSTPTEGTSGRMQMYLFTVPPTFSITAPMSIAGTYPAREGNFTAPNRLIYTGTVSGQVVYYNDDAAGTTHDGCTTTGPANSVTGKIALIDASSGTCTIISRVKRAQTAGAIGVLFYYPTLVTTTGTDNTVTIPVAFITTADANNIITQLGNNVPVNVTLASGIYRDGDLDNGVICHEYTHGISNRLTGGPYGASCLGNAEQGGEGWSDYVSLMLTTNWTTASMNDGANKRPIGNYVLVQGMSGGGIRRYPYSTDMSIDPLTYANVALSTEVHNIGEVWCSALWDMTWNLIQQAGSITPNLYNSGGTGGNIIAMKLVMMGMKLQPCSPGFLDARDAILAADSILYGYAHKCAIWNAFARRGMGYSALQGLSTSATDQTAAYDLPSGIQVGKPLAQKVTSSASTVINHTVSCDCQPYTGLVVRDTIPTGFTYVRSTPTGTLNGNVLTFPATDFAASETKNFSITLLATATGCTIDSVLNDNREGNTAGGFTSSGTSTWTVSNTRSHTGTNSWFAPNLTTVASAVLTSTATAAAAQKPLSILSFWHNYRTETKYDGGVLEYSTDGGTTWVDARPLFMRNPYTTAMDASTTLSGRTAFSGNSEGFIPSLLNLSSLGTTPVQFRFRFATDNGVGVEGWYVDDIIRANGCGGILKTGMYSSTSVRLDTLSQPLFVVPPVILPVNLLSFYAAAVGSQVALDWKTVSEINVKDFTIEWSADGTTWSTIGNTAAQNRNSNSYSFVHTSPVNGANYYRIRTNDADGKFTYSPVRIVNLKAKGAPMIVLVPNPVSTDAVLYISKEAKARSVKVYDATGSLVRQLTVSSGSQQVRIATTTLSNGVYTVEATGESRHIVRMLVQH